MRLNSINQLIICLDKVHLNLLKKHLLRDFQGSKAIPEVKDISNNL